MCRRRFLRAADLLGLKSEPIDALRQIGWAERVNMTSLLPAWNVLCEKYLRARWSDQLPLLPNPDSEPFTQWSRFVHWQFFPTLVREDEVVRNVLRAVGALPSVDKDNAVGALRLYVSEMILPGDAPPWAPEEEADE
jgi:hypothetical protein